VSRRGILKKASRVRILRSAGRLLRRQGIARSSVADIMRAAGLTVGAFYAHFQSKDDLLLTAIREGGGQMWRREVEATRDLPPAARPQALVDAYLSRRHRDHPDDGCMLPASVAEIAGSGAAYRTALAEAVAGVGTAVDALFAGGDANAGQVLAQPTQPPGGRTTSVRARRLPVAEVDEGAETGVSGRALALIALMYGGLSLARGLGRTPLSDDLLEACRRAVGELIPQPGADPRRHRPATRRRSRRGRPPILDKS
jgi:TetR/AcrR family transcriptional regulator, transcriptional repressor for nem operon